MKLKLPHNPIHVYLEIRHTELNETCFHITAYRITVVVSNVAQLFQWCLVITYFVYNPLGLLHKTIISDSKERIHDITVQLCMPHLYANNHQCTCTQNLVEKVLNKRGGNRRFVQEKSQTRIPNFSELHTLLTPLVDFGALQHLLHNLQRKEP